MAVKQCPPSAYDANYLSLALANGRALATLDRRLAARLDRRGDRDPGAARRTVSDTRSPPPFFTGRGMLSLHSVG